MNHNPSPVPPEVFAGHAAVVGKTGSGKTSTAKTMVERLAREGRRVCILDPIKSDWWGITSNAKGTGPGLPFVILGGPRGHVPLAPASGAALGGMVGRGELPHCIIDLCDLSAEQLASWYVAFAEALFKAMKGVLHLVLEEADVFAPKERLAGDENMRIHWSSKLARAGRSKGIRLIVSSQRVQKLHNDVLGSCDSLVAHRLVFPADQKPINDWLKSAATKETADRIAASLAELKTGEAWCYTPEAGLLRRQFIEPITTFDNSRTPAAGDEAHDVATAPVNLEALTALLGDAVKEAEANDPKHLRKEIDRLKAVLRSAEAMKPPPIDVTDIRDRAFEDGKVQATNRAREVWLPIVEGLESVGRSLSALVERAAVAVKFDTDWIGSPRRGEALAGLGRGVQTVLGEFNGERMVIKPIPHDRTVPILKTGPKPLPAAPAGIAGPHLKILEALAWWDVIGKPCPSRVQVAIVAGYTASGGTFSRYLSALSAAGLIDYPDAGHVRATPAGQALVEAPPAAPTLADLHRRVMEILEAPHRKLMAVLLKAGGAEVGRTQLGELAGYEASGGTFNRYCSHLSSAGLIRYPRKTTVAAAPILFPEGLR